jgi:hypothetical protein
VSFTAHWLHTPIDRLLAMDWLDLIGWYQQAVEIRKLG